MKSKALGYLQGDELLHMSMIFPILRETAELIYAGGDGVFMKELESGAYMLSVNCPDKGKELLESVGKQELFCVHQKYIAGYLLEKYNFQNHLECYQAVYPHKDKGRIEAKSAALTIKKLGAEHAGTISGHYHEYVDQGYIMSRLERGELYGGFLGDTLCGFIGTHEEGTIGLLKVLEQYRRRGFGEELESFMINLIIDKGQTPFAQISTDNIVSIKLQKKLGFQISQDTLHWLF